MHAPLDPADAQRRRALVEELVASVPDFPKPGILFRDITPVLQSPAGLEAALSLHLDAIADIAGDIDLVVGIESRGFLFGMLVAQALGRGFVLVRKPGKLPRAVREAKYALEYGEDALQIHADAIPAGKRVLVVDDLLATGGTAAAACGLVTGMGGQIAACLFLIELAGLNGKAKLGEHRVNAVLRY